MTGAWNRECCFNDQNSIRINRIFLATFCLQSFNGFDEYLLSYSQSCNSSTNMQTLWRHNFDCCCCCLQWVNFECRVSVFKRRYLWNQIRYQETVNGVHACFSYVKIKIFISYPLHIIYLFEVESNVNWYIHSHRVHYSVHIRLDRER